MFKSFGFMGILFVAMFVAIFLMAVPVFAVGGGIHTDAVGVITQPDINIINYSSIMPSGDTVADTLKNTNLYNNTETFAQAIYAPNCREVIETNIFI